VYGLATYAGEIWYVTGTTRDVAGAASAFSMRPRVENSSPRAAAEPIQYFKKSLLKSFIGIPLSSGS
jgi:hypothetical protein